MKKSDKPQAPFTHRQGQFLAFIHLYRKLHRRGPAETDLVQFFCVTPPSAHSRFGDTDGREGRFASGETTKAAIRTATRFRCHVSEGRIELA